VAARLSSRHFPIDLHGCKIEGKVWVAWGEPMDGAQRDYYSLIARAVGGPHGSTREARQALYKHARSTQLHNIVVGAPRSASEIRREREALEHAIRAVESQAATAEIEQIEVDAKIISDLADLMAENNTRLECLYDVSVLPHPKETIVAAIERQIVRSPLEEHIDLLRSAAVFICNFIDGIGPEPLVLNALKVLQRPRSTPTTDASWLKQILDSPEYQRDAERSARLAAIAEKEDKEIEQRIAIALCIRQTLHVQKE
jgi:hypothetical protein